MQTRNLLQALALSSSLFSGYVSAFHKGFNIAATRPDGSCKVQADWENNFNVMKSLPGNFRDVRVYASSDCNTLNQAVPAALNTGIQILVGIWTENANHYNAEKAAFQAAVQQWGVGWISAVSVGSEDLYRSEQTHETTPQILAGQINEVRSLLSSIGGQGIWVGHVDTWTEWVKDENAAVIAASDFIGMDGYPYYQGVPIEQSKATFYQSISNTQAAIGRHKPGTPLWITETGWPPAGQNFGASVASVPNAQRYWQETWCAASPNYASYAFTLRDYLANPSFGVVDINFQPIYNLTCP